MAKFRVPGFAVRFGRVVSCASRTAGCSMRGGIALVLAMVLCGCASSRREPGTFAGPFVFGQDTFAYSNELFWVYQIDPATGRTCHHRRKPGPTYAQHCFVMARAARQFFQHATFDPKQPVADEALYHKLVRRVVSIDPRHELGATEKIVVPGYSNLCAFSGAREKLLKAECGSMWRSYFQRGNWRMIFHFSRRQQEQTAERLAGSIRRHRPPVVHLAHFPRLQINHALLLFDAKETKDGFEFAAYDPNFPNAQSQLFFKREKGRFYFPPQPYFAGGWVDVYEIYRSWCY